MPSIATFRLWVRVDGKVALPTTAPRVNECDGVLSSIGLHLEYTRLTNSYSPNLNQMRALAQDSTEIQLSKEFDEEIGARTHIDRRQRKESDRSRAKKQWQNFIGKGSQKESATAVREGFARLGKFGERWMIDAYSSSNKDVVGSWSVRWGLPSSAW